MRRPPANESGGSAENREVERLAILLTFVDFLGILMGVLTIFVAVLGQLTLPRI